MGGSGLVMGGSGLVMGGSGLVMSGYEWFCDCSLCCLLGGASD